MSETFESKVKAKRRHETNSPFYVLYGDAREIAREADASLAAKDAQLKLEAEVAVGVMTDQLRKIDRLTALNTAKGELIEFYTNYINSLSGYLSTHQMDPSDEQVEYGNRLRARIRSLENE